MGKVGCFAFPGLDLWFNSSDHLPPHLHVRKPGEWEIRVYFLLCTQSNLEFEMKWASGFAPGPSPKVRRRLLELVIKHRRCLLAEWEAKVCRQDGA